ncbi:MAG TPA: cupin domain-containing protein [Alphaproteobacteria bacterium]|jgi:mannose-6-phosphate isomerase-like protein (cupin superfamily)
MAYVSKISEAVEKQNNSADGPRGRVLLSQEDDLLIALNLCPPGSQNEFHYHKGSSQSFLCMEGEMTVRTKENEGSEPVVHHLTPGMCVLVPGNQYYQLHNESDKPTLLYQVKRPGDQIVVEGKGPVNNRDYFDKMRADRKKAS